jgi:hypothetical protein
MTKLEMAMETRSPIPRGYSSIRDGDREETSPVGIYKRGQFIPRWINGHGDEEAFPIPVPRGDPLNLHVTMFLCTS